MCVVDIARDRMRCLGPEVRAPLGSQDPGGSRLIGFRFCGLAIATRKRPVGATDGEWLAHRQGASNSCTGTTGTRQGGCGMREQARCTVPRLRSRRERLSRRG